MVNDAEKYKREDEENKKKIKTKNNLEAVVYQTREIISKDETKNKITEDEIKTVTTI